MTAGQVPNGDHHAAGFEVPNYPPPMGPVDGAMSSIQGYGQPLPGSEAPTVALPAGQPDYYVPVADQSASIEQVPTPQSIQPTPVKPNRRPTRIGAAWVALIVAAIVLIFLLIFIVQNSGPVQISYFGFEGTMPLGVAMLFAAVAGALTAGLLGTVRILQMRKKARRERAGT
jgi:uncharacterized integral membrane protein